MRQESYRPQGLRDHLLKRDIGLDNDVIQTIICEILLRKINSIVIVPRIPISQLIRDTQR